MYVQLAHLTKHFWRRSPSLKGEGMLIRPPYLSAIANFSDVSFGQNLFSVGLGNGAAGTGIGAVQ